MKYSKEIMTILNALKSFPRNIALRNKLANRFLKEGNYDEMYKQANIILELHSDNIEAKTYLGEWYLKNQKFSALHIIYEEMEAENLTPAKMYQLIALAYLRNDNLKLAEDFYEKALAIDSKMKNSELEKGLQESSHHLQSEIEKIPCIKSDKEKEKIQLTLRNAYKFGLDAVANEIVARIIDPYKADNKKIYKAYAKKGGGGILLYGPPGCGKTMIMDAVAHELGVHYIKIDYADILENNAISKIAKIFEDARWMKPCVLFFDNVELIASSRSIYLSNGIRNAIYQLFKEFDGLSSFNEDILVVGATNMPWNIDSSFRRPGRFDKAIYVGLPNYPAKINIFESTLSNMPIGKINYKQLAKLAKNFSGADIIAVINLAMKYKFQNALLFSKEKLLVTRDFTTAIANYHPTTRGWFSDVKPFCNNKKYKGMYDLYIPLEFDNDMKS